MMAKRTMKSGQCLQLLQVVPPSEFRNTTTSSAQIHLAEELRRGLATTPVKQRVIQMRISVWLDSVGGAKLPHPRSSGARRFKFFL